MAASKEGVVGRLYLEYQYFEAVQGFVQNPPRSNKDRQLFLAVLDACLDHVITASPSRLPTLLETLFPRFHGDEGVLLAVGKAFLRRRMHTEAEYFLQKILLEINPDCLLARESLRTMYDHVIPRWHFHMLNDYTRNSAYSCALSNLIGSIPDCSVLDIGSGTGLLSMLAIQSGAAKVYACEVDVTMATMSRDIIAANGMSGKISVINKISKDLSIPADLPERVCVVVTETVDAGLLGEAIVKTFRHAWSHLLLSPRQPAGPTNQIARRGHVIPCGATVYAMAVECPYIAKHSCLISDEVGGVSFRGVALEGSCKSSKGDQEPEEVGEREMVGEMDEGRSRAMCLGVRQSEKVDAGLEKDPYTCERLSCISGGYSQLSRPQKVLSVDFTNPEVPLSSVGVTLPVIKTGRLDAVATYYDLHLDSTVSISTSPYGNQNCCWEQAIYSLNPTANENEERNFIRVEKDDIIHIKVECNDSLMHLIVDKIEKSSSEDETGHPILGLDRTACHPISGLDEVYYVDRGIMSRLNDTRYHEVYLGAITQALKLLRSESQSETSDTNSEENDDKLSQNGTEEDKEEEEEVRTGPGSVGNEAEDEGELLSSSSSSSSSASEDEDFADFIALDLSHEFSILGLMAANSGIDFVQIGRCNNIYKSLLEKVAVGNGLKKKTSIKWVELEVTSEPSCLMSWDLVLCDVVSPQGIFRSGVFEEIGYVREYLSHSETVILPLKVKVHCVAISSLDLRAQTTVLGSVPTLGLDIARFINKYQVSHFIDMDTGSLVHERLTNDVELFSIDFNSLTATTTPFKMEEEVSMEVIRDGCLTGFLYWFTLFFYSGVTIVTYTPQPGEKMNHWHQSAFCLREDQPLNRGQTLSVRALIMDSLLDISLLNIH